MWSVGHDKILSPEIQKIVMVSNLGDVFGSHISGTGIQKKSFRFSDKSNIIPKNEENLSHSVHKSSNFAWLLQTVALNMENIFLYFY